MCVTGAGGFTASWLVKYLLSKGYMVNGTVRDPDDEKNDHLKKLDKASENLQLFKADLLDYEGLSAAISGCSGVFHVASPVPRNIVRSPGPSLALTKEELIEPCVMGTRKVLNACREVGVKKVVFVSSVGAIMLNPNWPKDQPMDEDCWSDEEFCSKRNSWYCLGKVIAERETLEFSKTSELKIVSICPSVIIGPMLQPTLNSSSMLLLGYLKGGSEPVKDMSLCLVDVRDLAEALMLAYEKPEVEGRYICSSYIYKVHKLVDKLKHFYPQYNYPDSFREDDIHWMVSSEKLQNLGWKYRPLEETIVDAVTDYQEKGVLYKDSTPP